MPEPPYPGDSTVSDLIWYDIAKSWGGAYILAGHDGKIWVYEGYFGMDDDETYSTPTFTGYRVN